MITGCFLGLLMSASPLLRAELLSSSSWSMQDPAGAPLALVKDNDIATGVLLSSTQPVIRCVIDLGPAATVHRVYLNAADRALDPAATEPEIPGSRTVSVSIRVTDSLANPGPVLATREMKSIAGREIRAMANIRLPPATGRYLLLDLNRGVFPNRWNLGEVEVYGWAGDWRAYRQDAVAVATNAPAPLQLAASELSYYLGELMGRPVPVVAPAQVPTYTGTIYRVEDLKPLAQTYEQMTNNLAQGVLPASPVNVVREGREVVFRAWPYRNALWSVWEFLDRQGVKWVYPDAHGDLVPTGQGVDLSVAPLQFTPSTDFIYANFGVEYLRDDPDAFLHYWRNRWTHTWGGHQRDVFDGTEVPTKPRPNTQPKPEHAEGFDGYPHNFNNVLPDRILAQNPSWYGVVTNRRYEGWIGAGSIGERLPAYRNHCTFDLTNPDARQFIINKAVDCWNSHVQWTGPIYWMLPEDSTLFSEDPVSMAMREPLTPDYAPYAMPYHLSVSGDYYDFVCAIANGIRVALPEAKVGAMAYSNTHLPPNRERFPSNVLVDICMYGDRNLPITSPKNAEMKARLEAWAALVADRRHYDYDLIHSESGALKMPVPLVGAMADRARFYHQLDMLDGGTQADLDTIPYNPWNYYAYPRFHWDVTKDPADVIDEFFLGHFREAAVPMREYYTTLERFVIANNVSMQARGYDYGLRVGAYPINVLRKMQQHLLNAEAMATYWVTKQRVARIREGFDWILQKRGLSPADLTNVNWIQRVGPGSSTMIDMRTAAIQTAGQDVGDAWFLFSWAEVGDFVHFEQPGRYEVSIRAGMGYSDPAPRRRDMLFRIGTLEYGPFRINHESIDTYRLIVEVPAGVMEVACVDLNNDGPFEVSTITIEGVSQEPFPTSFTRLSKTHVYDFAADGNPADRIDSDWDGASDLHEIIAGTDELDPDSFFAVRCFVPAATGPCLIWPSVEGKRYALHRSSTPDGVYELVADNIAATPPENAFADTGATGLAFYQVSVR